MDSLFLLGQVLCIAALACGAWISFAHIGEFDAESLRRDVLAARAVRARGHTEAGGADSRRPAGSRRQRQDESCKPRSTSCKPQDLVSSER
jgi:hypothetical protein